MHTRVEGRPKSTRQRRALGINTCSQWVFIQECVEFMVMERNHHENISFVLFRAWHGTIDSGLFRLKLRYSKTRIAYYSNYMANQALLLSGDLEKNPGPSKGKVASTNNNLLSRSKPTAAGCDHWQKTIR